MKRRTSWSPSAGLRSSEMAEITLSRGLCHRPGHWHLRVGLPISLKDSKAAEVRAMGARRWLEAPQRGSTHNEVQITFSIKSHDVK